MTIGDDVVAAGVQQPSDYSRFYTYRDLTTTEHGWEENVIGPTQRYGHVVNEEEVKDNLKLLCKDVLDPCADVFGPTPLASVYRNPLINFRVGGSENSAHPAGLAADCTPPLAAQMLAFLHKNWAQFKLDRVILEQRVRLGGSKVHWLHLQHLQRGVQIRKDPLYFYSPDARTFNRTHVEWMMGWLMERSKQLKITPRKSDGRIV